MLMADTSLTSYSLLTFSTHTVLSVELMSPTQLKVFSMPNHHTLSQLSWYNGQMCSLANQEKYLFFNLGLFDLFWIQ